MSLTERIAEMHPAYFVLGVLVLVIATVAILYQHVPKFREWCKNLSPGLLPVTRQEFEAFKKATQEEIRGIRDYYDGRLREAMDEALDGEYEEDRGEQLADAARDLVDRTINELRQEPSESMRSWARQQAERLIKKAAQDVGPECQEAVCRQLIDETAACVSEHLGRGGKKRSAAGTAYYQAVGAEMSSQDVVGHEQFKQFTLQSLIGALPEVVPYLLKLPKKERPEHIHVVLDELGKILLKHSRALPEEQLQILLDAFGLALEKVVKEPAVSQEMERQARENAVAFTDLERLPKQQRNQVEQVLAAGVVTVYREVLVTDEREIAERRRNAACDTLVDWTNSLRELRPELVEEQVDPLLVEQLVVNINEPDEKQDRRLKEAQVETLVGWSQDFRTLRPDLTMRRIDPALVTRMANRVKSADDDPGFLGRLQPVQDKVIIQVAGNLPDSKANFSPLQNALVRSCSALVATVRWDRKFGRWSLPAKLERAYGDLLEFQIEALPDTSGAALTKRLQEPLIDLAAERVLVAQGNRRDGLWKTVDPALHLKLARCVQGLSVEVVTPVVRPTFFARATDMARGQVGNSYDLIGSHLQRLVEAACTDSESSLLEAVTETFVARGAVVACEQMPEAFAESSPALEAAVADRLGRPSAVPSGNGNGNGRGSVAASH